MIDTWGMKGSSRANISNFPAHNYNASVVDLKPLEPGFEVRLARTQNMDKA
jgi:hypothetical protein